MFFNNRAQSPPLTHRASQGLQILLHISVSIVVCLLVAVILWLLFSGLEAQSMFYFSIDIITNCIRKTVTSGRVWGFFHCNFSPNLWQMSSGGFFFWHCPPSPHPSLTWPSACRDAEGAEDPPPCPQPPGTLSPCPSDATAAGPLSSIPSSRPLGLASLFVSAHGMCRLKRSLFFTISFDNFGELLPSLRGCEHVVH